MGIRVKISLAMILLLVVSVSFIGVYAYRNTANALQKQKEAEFGNIVADLQDVTESSIEDAKQIISFMVKTPAIQAYIQEDDVSSAEQLLQQATESYARIETLLLTGEEGNVVASSDNGGSVGLSLRDREYFQSAMLGNVTVSEVIVSRITGSTAFTVAVPLVTNNGGVRGALVAVLNFNEVIGRHVQGVRVGDTGYAWMVDQDGLVVSHPNEDHILTTNLAENDNPQLSSMVRRMGEGEAGRDFYTFEGQDKFSAYAPAGNWALAFTMNVEEYMEPAIKIRNSIFLVAVIFILIGLILSNVIARQIGNPVINIMQAMKKAETGELTVSVTNNGKDEIAQLSRSFNAMVAGQKEIITKVLESASSVSAASQELSAAVEESNASMLFVDAYGLARSLHHLACQP